MFGHAIGDELLCEIVAAAAGGGRRRLPGAARRRRVHRRSRPTASSRPPPRRWPSRSLAAVGERVRHRRPSGCASASASASRSIPADGNDAATLLANADAALYRAKAEGRGIYPLLRSRHGRAAARAARPAARPAVGDRARRARRCTTSRRRGSAARSSASRRWCAGSIRPAALISPGTFIPLAEESGLIIPMGEWILREACREAASWPKPLQIAHQPVAGPVPPRRPAGAGAFGPAGNRARAVAARARDHRRRADRRLLARGVDPAPAQGARRAHRDGRFRHRLFVAVLSAGVPVRQDQDRPGLHLQPGTQSAVGDDRPRGDRARPRPRPAGAGRGRGDRGAARLPGARRPATRCRAI